MKQFFVCMTLFVILPSCTFCNIMFKIIPGKKFVILNLFVHVFSNIFKWTFMHAIGNGYCMLHVYLLGGTILIMVLTISIACAGSRLNSTASRYVSGVQMLRSGLPVDGKRLSATFLC